MRNYEKRANAQNRILPVKGSIIVEFRRLGMCVPFRAVLLACGLCACRASAEQAAGIILASDNARLVRKTDAADLAAVRGDVLFAGDRVFIAPGKSGSLRFALCSQGTALEFRLSSGSAVIGTADVSRDGATVQGPARTGECALPEIDRDPAIGVFSEVAIEGERGIEVLTAEERARIGPEDLRKLESFDKQLAVDPKNLMARVGRAVILARAGLAGHAVRAFVGIGEDWSEQQWARTLGYGIASRQKSPGNAAGPARLYAAFIGVSQYEQKSIKPLQFADADAQLFIRFISRPRAQAFAAERQSLAFINGDARFTTVRSKLAAFYAQARATDAILLYIAAHGMVPGNTDDGFIVLHDTRPESVYDNGLSMNWLRTMLVDQAQRVSRVFLFVDTCHAERIGPIKNMQPADAGLRDQVQKVTEGKILALFATESGDKSFESRRYGGGHGAFTYFLLRGLNMNSADPDYGAEDRNRDGIITDRELTSYLFDRVSKNTDDRQRPGWDRRIENFEVSATLDGLKIPVCCTNGPANAPAGVVRDPNAPAAEDEDVRGVEWSPPPELAERTALEEESQQVLYRYLLGEEVPQRREDFVRGAEATEKALALAGQSLFLEARDEFFRGRVLIFDHDYPRAAYHLERAIRMDPASPYAYNALGMAYLEQARYEDAMRAFEDSIARAKYWAYPRHNLALAYLQRGLYDRAIATYKSAIALMPDYSYLRYNLGLIYYRLNMLDEAAGEYKIAFEKAPARAAPLVALGALMLDQGRERQARKYFGQAQTVLAANPEPQIVVTLRHNRAVLAARHKRGLDEARRLWRENIEQANYVPSRFALARTLAAAELLWESADEYRAILMQIPEQSGARAELAALLRRSGQVDEARKTIRDGLVLRPNDPILVKAEQDLAGPAR